MTTGPPWGLLQMVVLMDPMEDPDDILRAHRSREKSYLFDVAFDFTATQVREGLGPGTHRGSPLCPRPRWQGSSQGTLPPNLGLPSTTCSLASILPHPHTCEPPVWTHSGQPADAPQHGNPHSTPRRRPLQELEEGAQSPSGADGRASGKPTPLQGPLPYPCAGCSQEQM